ncbi:MAG: SMC-Scp complex subunit ScpB [Deltaproteobacteria bacterium]|jgi:segregation and condensation protein B|nr:MAG: SMC-Scp complex subunit ScpB [Deltaproteobacteria bacterium]
MDKKQIKSIIESLIFASDAPIPINKIREIIDSPDRKTLMGLIAELMEEYQTMDRGFSLREVAGGYQFRTKPECSEWVRQLKKGIPLKLSQAALETLAIIAYKQPVTRSEIEYIRGVDVGGILRSLVDKKLIRILGKKEVPGRPLIYGTSKRFLEVFALKDLSSLPTLQEVEEL